MVVENVFRHQAPILGAVTSAVENPHDIVKLLAAAPLAIATLVLVGCGGGTPPRPSTVTPAPVSQVSAERLRRHLEGTFFRPQSSRRSPAILVLGGSEGGTPAPIARYLARQGYPAFALAYFRVPGRPSRLCNIPLEYFGRALSWLRKRAGGHGVVVLGISRGSEAAILAAAAYPRDVVGEVALVPSSAVQAGLCSPPAGGVAWTLHGRPVPHLPVYAFGENPPISAPLRTVEGDSR
jgi:hypothetical protein